VRYEPPRIIRRERVEGMLVTIISISGGIGGGGGGD